LDENKGEGIHVRGTKDKISDTKNIDITILNNTKLVKISITSQSLEGKSQTSNFR
jgi:hypothetical protein